MCGGILNFGTTPVDGPIPILAWAKVYQGDPILELTLADLQEPPPFARGRHPASVAPAKPLVAVAPYPVVDGISNESGYKEAQPREPRPRPIEGQGDLQRRSRALMHAAIGRQYKDRISAATAATAATTAAAAHHHPWCLVPRIA